MQLLTSSSTNSSTSSPSASRFRMLVAACLVLFGVGCGGGASMMQPTITPQDAMQDAAQDIAPPAAETSCAGDVCFIYAER